MLRVAVLSRWHVHAGQYAGEVVANDRAELAAVWDECPDLGAAWAEELGVPFEPDLNRILGRDDIDAVSVTTPTDMHPDVMVRAAEAGKHIFTEKVLATTVAHAERIAAAVATAGVAFCISFPRRCAPDILYAKQALDEGLLGRVTALRVRIAHDGAVRDWLPEHFYDAEACGGGAMMDLGAHGMYLARWLLGQPRRVASVFSTVTGRAVDDNAVSVIEFEGGAIAVNETSFASSGSYAVEMDGTEGAFRMLSPAEGAQVRSRHLDVEGWHAPKALPAARPRPVDQWIDACLDGTPADFGMADAVALTEVMEAAYIAEREGKAVEIPGRLR